MLQSADPPRLSVTDQDLVIHQYRAHRDRVGERRVDNIMLLEVKGRSQSGLRLKNLRLGQRDTFELLEAVIGTRKVNKATGERVINRKVNLHGETRYVRFWGVHVLSMSEESPQKSKEMWWDGIPITIDQLIELLCFRINPFTFCKRPDERRHHVSKLLPLFTN